MTAYALNRDVTPLAEIDSRIAATPRGPLTLDPARDAATPLERLVAELCESQELPHLTMAASCAADAQLRCFPQNLFWDFDFYVASIHREAQTTQDYPAHLQAVTEVTVGLMRLYGQDSNIRFQYVHDFIYGFDWARWVRRSEETRRAPQPFSLDFLREIDSRGRDILALIEADDERYPQLRDASARNPFSFSREPDDELRLYRSLAERDGIPVQAWSIDARCDASRDFDSIRDDAAERLGLRR
jgi:hypothetical protein